jgi:hypothetical protein
MYQQRQAGRPKKLRGSRPGMNLVTAREREGPIKRWLFALDDRYRRYVGLEKITKTRLEFGRKTKSFHKTLLFLGFV